MRRLIILLLALVGGVTSSAGAATIRVPEDQPTIQAAIDGAVDGDHIEVAPGHYLLPAARTIGNFRYSLVVDKNVTIRARELYQSILDGTGDNTVLILIRAAAHIEGFILQNASKGLQQRYSPDVAWSARNLIVRDMTGEAFEINDDAGQVGAAVVSNVVVDRCHTGFATNDARGFHINNALVMNSTTAFLGYDHVFLTVSFTVLFNNASIQTILAGTPPVTFGPGVIEADPLLIDVSTSVRHFPAFPRCASPMVDGGNPDPSFDDVLFPPSLGSRRNDIGAYGGRGAIVFLSRQERAEILRQAGCVRAVQIDIKPGSFPNVINATSEGRIRVAILTAGDFNATTVDLASVRFGGTGPGARPVQVAVEDVDGDRDADLIVHFDTEAAGIPCEAMAATLTGQTLAGLPIEGTDSIQTVGCRR